MREIAGGGGTFLLGAVVVGAVIALAIATDAIARGGEERVAAQMDLISAPIEVLPLGVSATQLARGTIGAASLPTGSLERIASALTGSLRGLEPRLVSEGMLAGRTVVLVGTSGASPPLVDLGRGEIAVGSILAQRLGLERGDLTLLMGENARVGARLPSTGSIDDLSAFLPLDWLQRILNEEGKINHVRVFLQAGTDSTAAKALLDRSGLAANFIRRDRGDAVDRDAPRSLSLWRVAAFAAAGVACAAWLAFAARLNLAERRREMATLAAIGAGSGHIVATVVLRSAATAALGALLGIALGTAAGYILQAPSVSRAGLVIGVAVVTVILSAVVAAPVAALAARADPVEALEER
jgi:putative ABC transport system permease protein